ncbi:fumarylacetoacetate hydrolase family protein [Roseicyclus sp.]|uniref:fumarylacetoacetate hydrolase family protein n=1 Tax=Roseicyclus sp. TaxID=1914329 RepID=UPI003F9ED99B
MTTETYVIDQPEVASLPVRGTEARFPVHRIYCVGRNYAAHAVEMGHDPDKEPPFFFQKSPTCLVSDGKAIPYPTETADFHHEIELVVALSKGGRDIATEDALGHVWGYAVGLDMTRRDIQAELKKAQRPWCTAKSFDGAAPCGALVPAAEIGHPDRGAIWLDVNGERRQEGALEQMIWKVPETIALLSRFFELRAGDLIMTGTPAGVGALRPGDSVHGHVDGVGDLRLTVA